MATATHPDELKVLGQLLQERLQTLFLEKIPFRVRCANGNDGLVILVEHPATETIEAPLLFRRLQHLLTALHLELTEPIQVFVRQVGQTKPYAAHQFELTPTSPTVEMSPDWVEHSDTEVTPISPDTEDQEEAASTQPEPPEEMEQPLETEDPDETPATPHLRPKLLAQLQSLPLPMLMAGAGVSALAFITALIIVSRPCVVGACSVLTEAQSQHQQALKTLQGSPSGKEILQAQQQLEQTIVQLEAIPAWSPSHGDAQQQLSSARSQLAALNLLIAALNKAAQAAQESQNPPHSIQKWGDIQQTWREAITQLETVPKQPALEALKQQKIKEYRNNLATINLRVKGEQQALANLEGAKMAMQMAEARQGIAQSLEDWNRVTKTWETALERLEEIPVGTTYRSEAQQILVTARPQYIAARDRSRQELTALNHLKTAQNLARIAKTYEQGNQWTLAVTNWRNALVRLQQIPANSFPASQIEPLSQAYTNALKQAEVRLQYASNWYSTEQTLKNLCAGTPNICEFSINAQLIQVRLTPAYMQQVTQSFQSAKASNDNNTKDGIVNHLQVLGKHLEGISNRLQIPLEIYTPDGKLISRYPKS